MKKRNITNLIRKAFLNNPDAILQVKEEGSDLSELKGEIKNIHELLAQLTNFGEIERVSTGKYRLKDAERMSKLTGSRSRLAQEKLEEELFEIAEEMERMADYIRNMLEQSPVKFVKPFYYNRYKLASLKIKLGIVRYHLGLRD